MRPQPVPKRRRAGKRSTLAVQQAAAGFWTWIAQLLAIALAIVSWGSYGPVLHKGQAAMHHSRLRPLICVGLAYFVIAVVVPYFFLGEMGEASTYRKFGHAVEPRRRRVRCAGALGIIMAFNSGGKPVFVMPLVFGGAPVVNTLYSVATHGPVGRNQSVLLGRTDSGDCRRGDGAGLRAARGERSRAEGRESRARNGEERRAGRASLARRPASRWLAANSLTVGDSTLRPTLRPSTYL